jgi:hypothetical protein
VAGKRRSVARYSVMGALMSQVRKIIAGISQFAAAMLVIAFTIYTGFYSWGWARTIRFVSDQILSGAAEMQRAGVNSTLLSPENLNLVVQVSNLSDPTVWAVIGAAIGFLISTAVLGIVFMLAEIAHNTRLTVAFFERVNSRANAANARDQ